MSLTVWSDYLRHLSLVKAAAFLISSYFEAMDPDELNNGQLPPPDEDDDNYGLGGCYEEEEDGEDDDEDKG